MSKYRMIADRLRKAIESGRYPPGSLLPSHTNLMAEEGVSLGTIRHALNVLVVEGLAQPEHGRGVRVLDRSKAPSRKRLQPIGVVIVGPQADDPVYMDVVKGISAVAATQDSGVLVFVSEAKPDNPELQRFLCRCDSVVLMGALEHAHLLLARRSGVPYVIAGHTVDALDEQENSAILLDVEAAAGMALQMLAGLGHRRIAFCPEPVVTTYQRRLIAAAQSCAGALGVALTATSVEEGHAIEALLGPGGVTAFLAQPPPVARQIIARAGERGMRVPQDLSIVTIGRAERASLKPIITQVIFDLEELGRQCARILLGNGRAVVHRTLPPAFLPGETLAPPRH